MAQGSIPKYPIYVFSFYLYCLNLNCNFYWNEKGKEIKEKRPGTLRYAKCEILFACFVVSRGLSLVSEETLGQYFSRKLPPTFFDASVMELYTYLVGRRR